LLKQNAKTVVKCFSCFADYCQYPRFWKKLLSTMLSCCFVSVSFQLGGEFYRTAISEFPNFCKYVRACNSTKIRP